MDDMLTVAERFGIGGAPRVLREVRQAMKDWPEFAAQAIDGQTRRSGLHGPFAVEPSGIVIAMIQKPRPSRLLRCHA